MSPFLVGITWLLLFQCAGEASSRLLGIPVPGPVIGMRLLFLALRARNRVPDSVGTAADGLAKNLSLLFVPAGVGVMMYFSRLGFGLHGVLAAFPLPLLWRLLRFIVGSP